MRDQRGRLLCKSLGNSPDPLDLIAKYGADGVRMGMMLSAPAGIDNLFHESLCLEGMGFCNKIWNAFRLVSGWETAEIEQPKASKIAIDWFEAKMKAAYAEINDLYSKYRLNEALMTAFKLFTDEFSGWYLEMIKPGYQKPIDKQTYDATLRFFDYLMRIIHPFMPFITEEIWQHIYERKDGESIMVSTVKFDELTPAEETLINDIETVKNIVAGVRTVRNQKNIAPKEVLELKAVGANTFEAYDSVVCKMANLESIEVVAEKSADASAFMVGTSEYAVPLGNLIDVDAEIEKLEAQLKHLQGFLVGVRKKLGNERFVQNAKPEVVALERKKEQDSLDKIAAIEASLAELRK